MLDAAPTAKVVGEMKRRRDSTPENEDQSPDKKRFRKDSPPRMGSVPLSMASLRRSASVKALVSYKYILFYYIAY